MKRRSPSRSSTSASAAGRRPWKRWWVGAAAVLAALGLVVGYGWRFGWSELPEPVPGVLPADANLYAPAEVPASNFWHTIRALGRETSWLRHAAASVRGQPGGMGSGRFARGGELSANPELADLREAAVRQALAAQDWRPPATLSAWDCTALRALVWNHVLIEAERAASAGETFTALLCLAEAWQLLAALWNTAHLAEVLDERGLGEVQARLVRPLGAWVLHHPGLEAEQLRQVLRALEIARDRSDGPATLYARQVTRARALLEEVRRPSWAQVSRAAFVAGWRIEQDTASLVTDLWDQLNGGRQSQQPDYHGARHLLRPLGELVAWMQARLARPADFDRLEAACVSRTLEVLRRHTVPAERPLPAWWVGSADARPFWQRWLDRPAVWRLPRVLPPAQPVLRLWQEWRWALESCRVLVALRAYRDQHGHWPSRLAELVPTWLDEVPADPFRPGAPLGYIAQGEDWQLWVSAPPRTEAVSGLEVSAFPRRLRASEFLLPAREVSDRD